MDLRTVPYNFELEFSEEELVAQERATTVVDDAEQSALAPMLQPCQCSQCLFDVAVVDLTDTNLDDHECITKHPLFDMMVITTVSLLFVISTVTSSTLIFFVLLAHSHRRKRETERGCFGFF